MPAYLIALVQIHDVEIYKRYAARSPAIVAKHGGRILHTGQPTSFRKWTDSRRLSMAESVFVRDWSHALEPTR